VTASEDARAIASDCISRDQRKPHARRDPRFNYQGWTSLGTNRITATARYSTNRSTPTSYQIGDTRTFNYADNSPRTTTLAQTATTSDGTIINLWVESGELGATKISPQLVLVTLLITQYAQADGIYDMLVRVGGPSLGSKRCRR